MENKPNGLLAKIKKFLLQDLWVLEPSSLSNARRKGLHFLRVCALVFKGFREDHCPLHAAALTFISVMALVPFLVILFAIAKGVGLERGSELLLEKTAGMPDAFQQAVSNIITTVESASAGAIGGIGGVLFMWVAIKMLSNVEETFNLVWGVKTPRSLIEKVKNYIVIMVLTPILLIIATSSQPVIMGLASRLEWMGPLLKLGLQLVPIITMALAFSMVYVFLPNTKVKFPAALMGALVAALLSVIFQFAIIKLGVGVSKYNKIYGALAAIPFFLFWVQISWMILLMGAEVAFSVQNAGTYAREQLAVSPSARARLCLAVALMKRITEKFESPENPFDTKAYGIDNRIPIRLINDVINTLAQAGLVAESAEHPDCYTLLRDPRNITARDIIDSILDDGAAPAALGLAGDFPMFGKITGEGFQALEKQTLEAF
ncbi:YihY/virulence factor BrkB family protein [Tichowtungia aerotolerans]|uniref:YihY family inner membrane protein n=1 Tax=Tichowtungia aerotolerans TaxID=2697043 RepID=A0A6P1M2K1_9BACT|nr:YihY/virulence factor BrkB family protein [Tichowtungia aerotolerans]QHI69059.1 YihY family inner membrane protein [Tichowtungia aerotolerans]